MNHKKFAIVISRFNEVVTSELLRGALARFSEYHINENNITVIHVPGAVEIPLAAQLLAQTGQYHAIVTLGAVIRGDTSHYDYVCQQVSQGCQRVMLDFNVPVIFGILTTDNEEQALDRVGGKAGHKGKEAVDASMIMCKVVDEIKNQQSIAA